MKLSMEALKERAGAVASTELLNSISGGMENACHDDDNTFLEPLLFSYFNSKKDNLFSKEVFENFKLRIIFLNKDTKFIDLKIE